MNKRARTLTTPRQTQHSKLSVSLSNSNVARSTELCHGYSMTLAQDLATSTDSAYVTLHGATLRVLSTEAESENQLRLRLYDLHKGEQSEHVVDAAADLQTPDLTFGVCTWCHGADGKQTFLCSESHVQFTLENLNAQDRYLTRYVDYKSIRSGDEFIAVELPNTVSALVIGIYENDGKRIAETELGAEIIVPSDVDLGDTIHVAPYQQAFVSKVG